MLNVVIVYNHISVHKNHILYLRNASHDTQNMYTCLLILLHHNDHHETFHVPQDKKQWNKSLSKLSFCPQPLKGVCHSTRPNTVKKNSRFTYQYQTIFRRSHIAFLPSWENSFCFPASFSPSLAYMKTLFKGRGLGLFALYHSSHLKKAGLLL